MPSPIFIRYRDTATGIEATQRDDYRWPDDAGIRYQYGRGNYGCDCNRSMFLRASGHPDFDELDCNWGENRIAIDWIKDVDGRLIYSDTGRDE